jgi:hypothetical protein
MGKMILTSPDRFREYQLYAISSRQNEVVLCRPVFLFRICGAVACYCRRFLSGSDIAKDKMQALPCYGSFFSPLLSGAARLLASTLHVKLRYLLTVLTAPGACFRSSHPINYTHGVPYKKLHDPEIQLPITAALVAAYSFTSMGCAV